MTIAKRPVVVGISGGSGAGKSWIARKIKAACNTYCEHLELDGYYKSLAQLNALDFKGDDPGSINYADATKAIVQLKAGKDVKWLSNYNHTTGIAMPRLVFPEPILIVEGHVLFFDAALRAEIDVKVWIHASCVTRYDRRVIRDRKERGKEFDSIRGQWLREVQPAFEKHIRPLRQLADIVVLNSREDEDQVPLIVPMLVAYVRSLPYALPPK